MSIRPIFGATFVFALSAITFGQGSPPRYVALPKDPPKAIQKAIAQGAKSAADLLQLSISLKLADPAGLQAFVDSVSDPKNANYHHFITPTQVGNSYGLPLSEVQKVTTYLESEGMKVQLISYNRQTILFDATVAQAEAAFKVSIEDFTTPASGTTKSSKNYSFTTSPMVPSTFAADIQNIGGIENFTQPRRRNLTPTQLRTLYSIAAAYNAGYQGQGRTIGISSYDGFAISNEVQFVKTFGLPSPSAGAGKNITVETIDGGSQSGPASGEGDLDIQATIGMAPLANLIVYDGGSSNSAFIDVLTKETNDNSADIITESYGWQLDTATSLAAHNLHLSMSAQGITYMAAAGDSGTDFQGYNYPDIDPEVLSVGGTSVTVDSNNNRSTEVGWNNSSGAGAGGWIVTTDTFNTHPSWQVGTGVPSATAVPYRLVPDVSFDADPNTGYFIYATITGTGYGEYEIGGTSGASPTCAGQLADAEQQLIALGALTANGSGNYRFGRIQDLLYSYNGNSTIFYDVTLGTNGTLPNGSTSEATVGWDTVSGWGPIIWSGFVAQVAGNTLVTSLTDSPISVVGGNSSTGTVTISQTATGTGTVVSLTSSGSDAQVPSTVTVAAGSTTATFTITTNGVASSETLAITASIGSSSQSANITILPVTLSGVLVSPSSVIGGNQATGAVSVNGNAPPGGLVVSLASNNTTVKVPSTVTIAAGATSATFVCTTTVVNAQVTATVTATQGTTSQTCTVSVLPSSLTSLTVSPTVVVGGSSTAVIGTVTLNGPAGTLGQVISLKSSNTADATVPGTVTIPAGATFATFPVTTFAVNNTVDVTITGTVGASSQSATLQLQRQPAISGSVTFSNYVGAVPTSVTLYFRYTSATTPFTSMTVNLDANGNFTAKNVPAQSYDVYIQTGTWLRRTLSLNLTAGNVTNANFALVNGDVNGDNRIDIADLRLIMAAFGSVPGDSNWNPNADLNGDGKVDSADLAIYYQNYGKLGNP